MKGFTRPMSFNNIEFDDTVLSIFSSYLIADTHIRFDGAVNILPRSRNHNSKNEFLRFQ